MASGSNKIARTISEYGNRLFRFIRGKVRSEEDAEDILQEVWYQLTRIIDLEEIENMSGWLFQVARNRITDLYRKQRTNSLDDILSAGDNTLLKEVLSEDPMEDNFFKEIFWEEMMAALNELPEKQREVFVLNELEGLTLQEIADRDNENLKTIISRKRYAIKYLKKRLEDLYEELLND